MQSKALITDKLLNSIFGEIGMLMNVKLARPEWESIESQQNIPERVIQNYTSSSKNISKSLSQLTEEDFHKICAFEYELQRQKLNMQVDDEKENNDIADSQLREERDTLLNILVRNKCSLDRVKWLKKKQELNLLQSKHLNEMVNVVNEACSLLKQYHSKQMSNEVALQKSIHSVKNLSYDLDEILSKAELLEQAVRPVQNKCDESLHALSPEIEEALRSFCENQLTPMQALKQLKTDSLQLDNELKTRFDAIATRIGKLNSLTETLNENRTTLTVINREFNLKNYLFYDERLAKSLAELELDVGSADQLVNDISAMTDQLEAIQKESSQVTHN